MLLTKKSEYALLSLIYIAKSNTPLSVDELATNLNIPKPFLAKILQSFSKRNILKSYKGVNGGFSLIVEPSELTILDISEISEDKAPAVFECSPSISSCPTQQGDRCHIWPILNKLQNKIDGFLSSLTLKDIMQ